MGDSIQEKIQVKGKFRIGRDSSQEGSYTCPVTIRDSRIKLVEHSVCKSNYHLFLYHKGISHPAKKIKNNKRQKEKKN